MNTGVQKHVVHEPSAHRRLIRERFDNLKLAPYLFVLPFLLFFVCFIILPALYAGYLSLFKTGIVGGQHFVGLENYARALNDSRFWEGVLNVLHFGLWMIPILIGAALFSALILDSDMVHATSLFRIGIFIPYAIPGVIATLLWGYLYGPNYGLITQLCEMFGIRPPDLLSSSNIVTSIANISVWQYLGYNFIIFHAALQAVPHDLMEAATLDGANRWTSALYIKLPLIRDAVITALLFSIIGTVQLFNEPFLLQPEARDVVTSNFTPNIFSYSLAFRSQQYNYAGAVSFLIALITGLLSYLFLWISNRKKGKSQ
ncbi:carbohydrate ABC transporter permease [Paraburkholderia sp. DHOC27]|uniref:carbohydrate ABC transporter permease n=1 Tax=Paraburkholderia sp. DHOC27 TaxID=2303330 RepID=UPI000E3DB169|nr:sugar ABC transporter permease [Paraburkholderia sp. DHOC27]RFU49059.1 sugar ABC transporter permease [Paraburkholderia sp. DHOC27]